LDPSTSFLILIGIIAANQLVLRVAVLRANGFAFWGLQLVNLSLICTIFAFGLPGFERYPSISWAIGLIFALRVIQNNGLRAKFLRGDVKNKRASKNREVDAMLDSLQAGEDAATEE
jgi:hypothetical protein